ncbi:ATP synthase subunit c [uncultured archaeon]|nr:ATP synthase subunit c [uncultured archaeon]
MVQLSIGEGLAILGAGIAIVGGALGTGMAQSAIGSAIVGVLAEKPEEYGKMLLWLVIPETIIIFAFVIAILSVMKVGV